MIQQNWDSLSGKAIQIENMKLTVDDTMRLTMDFRAGAEKWSLAFENVSELTVRTLSFPAVISGFEIRDNLCRGWEENVRYTVRDYEDGKLTFHCQQIHAYKKENSRDA